MSQFLLSRLPITTVLTVVLMATSSASVSAADITQMGDLAGGAFASGAYDISADGSVVVGFGSVAGGWSDPSIWTSGGGWVSLGDLGAHGSSDSAHGVSADGSVIVGQATSGSGDEAFMWTAGGGMVGLGDFAGGTFSSAAYGVSDDGLVIAGGGTTAVGQEAFMWTSGGGMVSLGDFAGGTVDSRANGISGDGQVIVGYGETAAGREAFRWTAGGGMVNIGELAGGIVNTSAEAASIDGSVVAGWGVSGLGVEAFRWTAGGGMVALGDLAGGTFQSLALDISDDGSALVGWGNTAAGQEAMIWTVADGMERLEDVLIAGGADTSNWTTLGRANGISGDGTFVVGYGTTANGAEAFVANLAAGGLSTPTDLANSLTGASLPGVQAFSMQSMYSYLNTRISFHAHDYVDAASNAGAVTGLSSGDAWLEPQRWAGYAFGNFGNGQDNDPSNYAFNGATGGMYRVSDVFVVGGGALSGRSKIDTSFGGNSTLDSLGASAFVSYEDATGLRVYASTYALDLDLDKTRGYVNGAGTATSKGETNGYALSMRARVGIEQNVKDNLTLTPFIELGWGKSHFDGYTENDGPFPATYGEQNSYKLVSRLGSSTTYEMDSQWTINGSLAWAHRVNENSNDIMASTTGVGISISPDAGDKNWVEANIGARYELNDKTALYGSAYGRSGIVATPHLGASIGVIYKF